MAAKMPELPDDDRDFSPELARKIIGKYQEIVDSKNDVIEAYKGQVEAGAAEIERLRAEVWRLKGIVGASMLETGSAGFGQSDDR